MNSGKWVFRFDEVSPAETHHEKESLRALLGGKGASLAEMSRIGLPVPPGFVITTEACVEYLRSGGVFPDGLVGPGAGGHVPGWRRPPARASAMQRNPLLVSCRSGAMHSMPGMMDTVLNVGLNEETAAGLAGRSGDARFAFDAYRRLVQMFGNVVLELGDEAFQSHLDAVEAGPARRCRTRT